MGTDTNEPGIWRWFSHPAVGLIGTVASLISIPLACLFYFRSIPSRDLVVVEPPVRSVFLNHDAPESMQVRVNGEDVTKKDVFAVQFAVWNHGNQSIRPENVLEPLVFKPEGDTRIVAAKVLRRTRDICGITAKVMPEVNAAKVEWSILEHGDGAIIQLVLVGEHTARVGSGGTIEGGGKRRFVRKISQSTAQAQKLWDSDKSFLYWLLFDRVSRLAWVCGI